MRISLSHWRHLLSVGVGLLVSAISFLFIEDVLQTNSTIVEPVRLKVTYDCPFENTLGKHPYVTLFPLPEERSIKVHVQVSDAYACDNAVVFTTAEVSNVTLEDVVFFGPTRSVEIVPKTFPTSLIEFPNIAAIWGDLTEFNVAEYKFTIHNAVNKTSRSEFSITVDFISETIFPNFFSSEKPLVTPSNIELRVVPPHDYILAQAVPPSASMDASEQQGAYKVQLSVGSSDFLAIFRSQIAQQRAELQLVIWSTILGIGIGLVLEILLGLLRKQNSA